MSANRVGKHRALMAAATLDGLVHCAFLAIPAGQLAALGLCYALTGIAYGATSLLPRAMMADISDEEQLQHGVERSGRSEEHTSELQSLMRISYAVFCLKKKKI